MEELKVKVMEVSQEKEQPQGNDFIRVVVEIDGRKNSRMDYRKQYQCSML